MKRVVKMTIIDLLSSRLPYKYVVAIIANMDEKETLDNESSGSLLEEIVSVFDWETSYEGKDFWLNVYTSIKEGTALPRLPFKTIWLPNTYLSTESGSLIMNSLEGGINLAVKINANRKPINNHERFIVEKHLSFCN